MVGKTVVRKVQVWVVSCATKSLRLFLIRWPNVRDAVKRWRRS
ncbi:Uncharacterised protein [Vibrio cholerae]|nr:Uncharacterised protein [Vibrio cholerae]CSI21132.1 Uncharacterised protein [Vibrio cholerae]